MRRGGRYYNSFLRLGILAAAVFFAATALAASSISQGYISDEELVSGTLVSSSQEAGKILPADLENLENLLGVVVPEEDSLISLSGGGNNTYVATEGIAKTLVSDINGEIKIGDKVTVSPMVGVGMVATHSTRIIGTAQADFDPSAEGNVKRSVTNRQGEQKEVSIGRIPVLLSVTYFVSGDGDDDTYIPKFIRELAHQIAGRQVSPFRIIMSGGLILLGLFVISVLLYGSVRSSIISIGRNPLSHPAVWRSLMQVIGISAVILAVMLTSVYFILTR